MTKSKPKPVKPAISWCVVDRDRPVIRPGWCTETRRDAVEWRDTSPYPNPVIIRVEIRPAPKRKSKRTKP